MIRIYGTDCGQVPNVLKAANAKGMKVFAGIYDISDVESEAQIIIDAAKGNWDAIDTVSVGNEAVNNGAAVSDVVSAVNKARSMLKAAGYNGKVVTVDVFSQIIDNPELCQVSDFAAANCHAFFDADVSADGAGKYVAEQAKRVQQACGGKDTVITESGWPNKGDTNGAAVPSEANQKAAISSLRSAFSDNIVLFSAFDDLWKTNTAYTYGAEQYWGIYGMAPA
jgi:exo-beta-1,3-glucanase (GH17 family)